jgi:hypothetical protein
MEMLITIIWLLYIVYMYWIIILYPKIGQIFVNKYICKDEKFIIDFKYQRMKC